MPLEQAQYPCKYRNNRLMAKWKKGESGNPAGRPKGARDRLSQAVYKEILEDWAENGAEVIRKVRAVQPALYLQAVIRLVPTAHDLTLDDARKAISEYSTEELAELIGAGKKAA